MQHGALTALKYFKSAIIFVLKRLNIPQIKALLRGHTAFEDYPEHVKDQLAQVFVYQR